MKLTHFTPSDQDRMSCRLSGPDISCVVTATVTFSFMGDIFGGKHLAAEQWC